MTLELGNVPWKQDKPSSVEMTWVVLYSSVNFPWVKMLGDYVTWAGGHGAVQHGSEDMLPGTTLKTSFKWYFVWSASLQIKVVCPLTQGPVDLKMYGSTQKRYRPKYCNKICCCWGGRYLKNQDSFKLFKISKLRTENAKLNEDLIIVPVWYWCTVPVWGDYTSLGHCKWQRKSNLTLSHFLYNQYDILPSGDTPCNSMFCSPSLLLNSTFPSSPVLSFLIISHPVIPNLASNISVVAQDSVIPIMWGLISSAIMFSSFLLFTMLLAFKQKHL